ncbi:MAG: hypothetical protein IPI41_08570 [Flavobacteriales bacterium]|nr:hypothetical protein [Flavobacteriales bacterium]
MSRKRFTIHLVHIARVVAASLAFDCAAQPENNWWYFNNVAVDFNGVAPVVHTNSAMNQGEGSSSISNADGDLLFYTDGVSVWNRTNSQMSNGYGLLGQSSATQSALIVPKPSNCQFYYIFTVPSQNDVTPLSYSVVDMTLDGGLGDITLKNVPLIAGVTERLSATLHANGVDRWVVGQRCSDLAIVSFRLTASGVDPTPVISPPPPPITSSNCYLSSYIGSLKIAPDGSRLCTTFGYGVNAYLMDYDPLTGLASATLRWSPFLTSGGYGVEFSPNSSRLYLQTANVP